MTDKYNVSFRCFFHDERDEFGGQHCTQHYCADFPLSDIPRWIDSYKFTHPECFSISVKVWFSDARAEHE